MGSAYYASRNAPPAKLPKVSVGDKVFIKSDISKSKVRDTFVVLENNTETKEVTVQKFPAHRKNILKVQHQNIFPASKHPNPSLRDLIEEEEPGLKPADATKVAVKPFHNYPRRHEDSSDESDAEEHPFLPDTDVDIDVEEVSPVTSNNEELSPHDIHKDLYSPLNFKDNLILPAPLLPLPVPEDLHHPQLQSQHLPLCPMQPHQNNLPLL